MDCIYITRLFSFSAWPLKALCTASHQSPIHTHFHTHVAVATLCRLLIRSGNHSLQTDGAASGALRHIDWRGLRSNHWPLGDRSATGANDFIRQRKRLKWSISTFVCKNKYYNISDFNIFSGIQTILYHSSHSSHSSKPYSNSSSPYYYIKK